MSTFDLEQKLKDSNPETRAEALSLLVQKAEAGNPAGYPHFLALASDSDARVRRAAYQGLLASVSTDAIATISKGLMDPPNREDVLNRLEKVSLTSDQVAVVWPALIQSTRTSLSDGFEQRALRWAGQIAVTDAQFAELTGVIRAWFQQYRTKPFYFLDVLDSLHARLLQHSAFFPLLNEMAAYFVSVLNTPEGRTEYASRTLVYLGCAQRLEALPLLQSWLSNETLQPDAVIGTLHYTPLDETIGADLNARARKSTSLEHTLDHMKESLEAGWNCETCSTLLRLNASAL